MKIKTGYNLKLKNILFKKLKYTSWKNKRSINAQLTMLVEQFIEQFEKINGKIEEKDLLEMEKEESED